MIVPEFWAEGRVQHKVPGRQVTVRRFGWSDTSAEEAQAMADARAEEALQLILAGGKLKRREPKVPYKGADGTPIREEILSKHGDIVITRNIYGARCLNTPDVLFVDVDYLEETPLWFFILCIISAFGYVVWHAVSTGSFGWLAAGFFIATLVGFWLALLLFMTCLKLRGGPSAVALRRIRGFAARHPDWNLRLYQTPAGFRLLAMHSPFAPNSPEVATSFKELGTDPVYVRMCQRQNCFRARLGPKPWRMGMKQKIKPRPGVWPVRPEHLPQRQEWIDLYETKAQAFASCRFIQTFGKGGTHPAAERVRELHDEFSRTNSGLPLA